MLSLATIPHFCVIIIVAAMAPFSFVWELIGFCQNHPKSFGTSCLTCSPLSLVGERSAGLGVQGPVETPLSPFHSIYVPAKPFL